MVNIHDRLPAEVCKEQQAQRAYSLSFFPFISSSITNNNLHETRTTHMQTYSIYTLNSNKTISHQDRYSLVTLLDDKQVPQR